MKLTKVAAASGALLLALPAGASAANSCHFDESQHAVTVVFDSSFEIGRATANSQSPITLDGATCQGATVVNTDTVSAAPVSGTSPVGVTVDMANGILAPGYTDETGAQPNEIEIKLAPYHDYESLSIEGSPANDSIRLGDKGVDLNDAGGLFDDTEITSTTAEPFEVGHYFVSLEAGDDGANASGGSGISNAVGNSVTADVSLYGGDGNDTLVGSERTTGFGDSLTGGDGDDALYGLAGEDYLIGDIFGLGGDSGRGNDLLVGGEDADEMRGGAGKDTVSYALASGPIAVDLTDTSAPDGGGEDLPGGDGVRGDVENLIGGAFDDTLIGSDSANVLDGGPGVDLLKGLAGNDRLKARDGVRDEKIDCGKGKKDRAIVDKEPPGDPKPKSC